MFQRVTDINGNTAAAWYNWGNLLSDRAAAARDTAEKKEFLNKAEEKYKRAIDVDPQWVKAWNNQGVLLLKHAACAGDDERQQLLQRAKKALEKAVALKHPAALFNLACVAAQQGQTEECVRFLEESYKVGNLPSVKELRQNVFLKAVRDTAAFKAFVEKVS